MNVKYYDALIIGGGLTGLRSAIAAKDKGLSAVVLSLCPVKRSHSAAAQGGMQASLGNSKMSEGDNEDIHFLDTVKGSDWGCDQVVARMFVQTAPKAIRELAGWGVPWTRIKKGKRNAIINAQRTEITEDEEVHGLIHSRDFGGTKKWRTCFTADATGHSMLYGVANQALGQDVEIRDRCEAISLIVEGGRCYGAVVRDLVTGELCAYIAKATMVATGGYGRLYKHTTNAVICEGVGCGLALETGIAQLGNMEAVQFHPTPIVPSGILLTEGCRGDGGVLRDKDGYRFMPDYEPEKKELASRDVVSRRIMEHIRKGKGVQSMYGEHVWLDISILGREHIERNLRDIQDISRTFNGIDPADTEKDANGNVKGWMPVLPMQHYSMGGIRTKPTGESPTLKGLFSAGEAACWDLHGFNRLGGNSVAETVVSGMIVGNYMADFCLENEIDIQTSTIAKSLQKSQDYLNSLVGKEGKFNVYEIKNKMKDVMWEGVGIFRTGEKLQWAVDELTELLKQSQNINLKCKELGANPELEDAYRVPMMLKVALCVAKGALERTESRGAHYREDFPKRDDLNWCKRTLTSWTEGEWQPKVSYEEMDIMQMELPPAFRGYGVKGNIIEHPDSALRQAQVDEIRQRLEAEGKGREEIQEALMHYELQPEFKQPNQRVKGE